MIRKSIPVIVAVAFAAPALAQVGSGGTITNGSTTFTLNDYLGDEFGAGTTADLRVGGPGNPDHLFQAGWWYRVAGDNREHTFANANDWSWANNRGRQEYSLTDFNATVQYTVTGVRDGLGFLTMTLTIYNTSANNLTINVFNYLDLDMFETAGDDSAVLGSVNIIRVTDGASAWRANYEGTNSYQVASFDNLRQRLTDPNPDDFDNTGLPFGPGDWTGGFQWEFTLTPNSAATASATVTIVPTPGALGLLGLGMLATLRRRR